MMIAQIKKYHSIYSVIGPAEPFIKSDSGAQKEKLFKGNGLRTVRAHD
ncbi:MAG: hypothetical protein P0116_02885 [Candidatus Nitrosocosmicus sp.]|nr:hypothetical protein [Candidatus Nitrosocosmicus sp.]